MTRPMKSYIEDIIPKDQIEEFGKWAFGENYQNLYGEISFMNSWNEIHEEKLTLDELGSVENDIKKMCDLFKNREIS